MLDLSDSVGSDRRSRPEHDGPGAGRRRQAPRLRRAAYAVSGLDCGAAPGKGHLCRDGLKTLAKSLFQNALTLSERSNTGFLSLSFEEAGDELFTFTAFPCSQWKALRTTNALERINEEFRRRTKTQASLPSEEAVLFLLFGLLRSGQITLRRLVGWHDLTIVSAQPEAA